MAIAIRISGTPRITGLDGLFFMDNPEAVGYDRVWRSKGTGRIYYDGGWKIGDIMSSMVYFAEDPEQPTQDGDIVWCENPWEVMQDNWRPAREEYADFRPVLTTTKDSGKTETYTEISEPCYLTTHEYYNQESTSSKQLQFNTVTPYYFLDKRVLGDTTLCRYIRIPIIVPSNKIDANTYYNYDSLTKEYSYTTDQYFISDHVYYIKDDGATPIPKTETMKYLDELDHEIATATDIDTRTRLITEREKFETAVSQKDWRTAADMMGFSKDSLFYQAQFVNATIPIDTYYVEAGTVLITLETVTDNRTGESVTKKNVQYLWNRVDLDLHKRYYVPDLEVGRIYRFSFVKDFRDLGYIDPTNEDFKDPKTGDNDSDITRGVFQITNQLTYYRLLLAGIDVYQNLYLPLQISRTVYEKDRKTWMNDDVWYELTDPSMPARIVYVPLSIISGIPDANVFEYDRSQLIIDIGVFQEPEFLAEVITDINLLMKAKFGIPTAAKLASYDKVYLPEEYYRWLEETRKENIKDFMSKNKNQFYNALFYDEYNDMYHQNLQLTQKNQAYEQMIAQLAGGKA